MGAKAFGAHHITVGVTLGLVADAPGPLGEYCKQKELSEFALLIEEVAFGSGSLKLCSTLSTLAAAHRNLCNYGQQKKFLDRFGTSEFVRKVEFRPCDRDIQPEHGISLLKVQVVPDSLIPHPKTCSQNPVKHPR